MSQTHQQQRKGLVGGGGQKKGRLFKGASSCLYFI
jgi:hypothetical protein